MGPRLSRVACLAVTLAATAGLWQTAANAASAADDPPPKDSAVTSGTPQTAPSPRALVLLIGQGQDIVPAATGVVLQCAPQQGGTHPRASEACALLGTVGGDLRKLKAPEGRACPAIYAPVTAATAGVWDGRLVTIVRTFGNNCEMRNTLGPVADLPS
ncbi:SSI family serine proteinase inhibitor [Sphaerisporangium sp. NPDC051011]|uniref:SSI family serine proteinase inhibitor n=1 Tax=Sphaerisporangium sp. NPDC051011 TaxID=3155792 RepID=UPI0033F07E1D